MLETKLGKGKKVNWLPAPANQEGTGGECNKGVELKKTPDGKDYIFLPYAGNGINYTEAQGKDVISCPFSGCIMATYKKNGSRRVCHVSTGADFGDCKKEWETVKGEATEVKEFKPFDKQRDSLISEGLIKAAFKEKGPTSWSIYGLITSDEKLYSVIVLNGKVFALEKR